MLFKNPRDKFYSKNTNVKMSSNLGIKSENMEGKQKSAKANLSLLPALWSVLLSWLIRWDHILVLLSIFRFTNKNKLSLWVLLLLICKQELHIRFFSWYCLCLGLQTRIHWILRKFGHRNKCAFVNFYVGLDFRLDAESVVDGNKGCTLSKRTIFLSQYFLLKFPFKRWGSNKGWLD